MTEKKVLAKSFSSTILITIARLYQTRVIMSLEISNC